MNRLPLILMLALFIGIFGGYSSAKAQEKALVIDRSVSPDGKKDLLIVPVSGEGVAAGTAKIRNVCTGKILGSFDWAGFGVRATNDAFTVLWSPDSRAFAIDWEETRGFVSCALYTQTRHGWRQVKFPYFYDESLKMARKAGEARIAVYESMAGKGHETVVRWLSNDRLQVEAGYRSMIALDRGDYVQLFWFTVKVENAHAAARPKAVLTRARLAPDEAYSKQ